MAFHFKAIAQCLTVISKILYVLQPFEILSELGSDCAWLNEVPEAVKCFLIPSDALYYVYGFWGYIVFQVLQLGMADLWDSQYYLNCPVTLSGSLNQPFIEQHNAVAGYFESDWDGIELPAERQGQGGLSAGPYMNNKVRFPAAGFYRNTDFHYPKESLTAYADVYPGVDKLLNSYEKKSFYRINGYADLKGEPNLLLKGMYDPHCRPQIATKLQGLRAEEYLIQILEQLHPAQTDPLPLSLRLEEMARHVEDLLNTSYNQPLTLRELAQKAGTNTEYLRRAFKARTGKTIMQYLTEVRVSKVKEFLRDTRLTLESIAMETGFSDGVRLGKVFRQVTGQTPMSYRGFRGSDDI